jgi:hypothetical protein
MEKLTLKIHNMNSKRRLSDWVGIFIMVIIMPLLFVTCEKDAVEPTGNNKAELSSISINTVSYTSGTFLANVNSNGNHNISDHGFCYSHEHSPDRNDSVKSLGNLSGKEPFEVFIENLQPDLKYYIRAFITIPTGTIYSQENSFTTLKTGKPFVISDSVFAISSYTASFSGTLVSDSGLFVTSRGF